MEASKPIYIVEGKAILESASSFLSNVLDIALSGNITLLTEDVSKVNDLLNQALRHEGSLRLARNLMSAATADKNRKQKQLQSTKSKSEGIVRKLKKYEPPEVEGNSKIQHSPDGHSYSNLFKKSNIQCQAQVHNPIVQ
eukprot:jgi/Psemu1/28724/gm1.28724_g